MALKICKMFRSDFMATTLYAAFIHYQYCNLSYQTLDRHRKKISQPRRTVNAPLSNQLFSSGIKMSPPILQSNSRFQHCIQLRRTEILSHVDPTWGNRSRFGGRQEIISIRIRPTLASYCVLSLIHHKSQANVQLRSITLNLVIDWKAFPPTSFAKSRNADNLQW